MKDFCNWWYNSVNEFQHPTKSHSSVTCIHGHSRLQLLELHRMLTHANTPNVIYRIITHVLYYDIDEMVKLRTAEKTIYTGVDCQNELWSRIPPENNEFVKCEVHVPWLYDREIHCTLTFHRRICTRTHFSAKYIKHI